MNFKDWLKNSKYKDKDPLSVKILYCNVQGLTDLKGIEVFKNLTILQCGYNKLSSLKGVKKLTNLEWLECYNNNLITLKEIRCLTNLNFLYCNFNNLEHKYFNNSDFKSIKDYQKYLKYFYRKEKIKNLILIYDI